MPMLSWSTNFRRKRLSSLFLLDILAGRKEKEGVRGEVLINGNDIPRNFKCCSGYVVQDDVVMGTLTVRENLAFSAALRLPSTVSQKEKKERVDETITELGLEDCKDTKVGTMFIRGVSGGERKRTNIGMELVIGPTVLFLDEPTTGLDANTAYTVMSRLAVYHGGRWVTMVFMTRTMTMMMIKVDSDVVTINANDHCQHDQHVGNAVGNDAVLGVIGP
nr:broad substrate specificity ATP-binding cassette transporter ABCG2-like [Lytechinus pictus]